MIRADARVLIVGCGSAKADRPQPAGLLYAGSLFLAARRAALADGRVWLICSAEHGLVHPDQVLAPYERALHSDADQARLAGLLAGQHQLVTQAAGWAVTRVEVWAGARYVGALRDGGLKVVADPLSGLGIGARIGWLTRHAASCADYFEHTGTRPGPYAAADWLVGDTGLVYAGSKRAHRGQPVVHLAESGWIDDGSLLGVQRFHVTLANGVCLTNVRETSLIPAEPRASARRATVPTTAAAATAAARSTRSATRGRTTT